ncbi:MAG TPA: protein kinase [Terracidiphilus sp.]
MDASDKAGGITRIGKYQILEELGHGGMGVVYRGVDSAIGREVAIKTLTQGFADDPSMLARFYDEVRITGNLNHPNIVTVYEVGDERGYPYIAMECVKGRALDKIIASRETMSLSDRLRIIEETCSALGYAHRNNVIHRDVKPGNIFVLLDGKAKLLDFGIARLEKRGEDAGNTRVGHLIGTVPYMAPERLRGEPLDGRSDIFAVGVVLFQLVSGQLPFTGVDAVLMQKILQEHHPSLSELGVSCPKALEGIIDRALAKDPDDRYSTADEMAIELSTIIAELRQGEVEEMISEARDLMQADQLAQARTVLNQIIRIDNKHPGAKLLLAEIQTQFTQRRREMNAQQIRQQAEDAFASKRFDQCLAILDGGKELFASFPDLEALRVRAQKEKEKQSRINELVSQAESARRRGDYKLAVAQAEKARKIDKTNPRIAALCVQLSTEAGHAQRQAEARVLLAAARGELNARRFPEAIDILRQAEELDPTNPELPILLNDAVTAQEQSRRREVINRLEDEVSQASTIEQLEQVATSIQGAMAEMPTESALFRLNAQVERLVREQRNRRLVEDTVSACRSLAPREALDRVREAQSTVPGDERLMNLEAMLQERLRLQTVDERRADYLARAREALARKQFSEAIRLMEMCDAEGIASPEILSLLDFARNEEQEHHRTERLRNDVANAQSLLADSSFDEAIAFLEESLRQNEDQALRVLLDQAKTGRDAAQRRIDVALASVTRFIQSSNPDNAIQFVEMQPKPVQRATRVRAALAAVEEEKRQAIFRTVGRAYAALSSDLPSADTILHRAQHASTDGALSNALRESFRHRQQMFADASVEEAVRAARAMVRDRNKDGAEKLLMSVSGTLPFASRNLRDEWEAVRRKATGSGLIARLRS